MLWKRCRRSGRNTIRPESDVVRAAGDVDESHDITDARRNGRWLKAVTLGVSYHSHDNRCSSTFSAQRKSGHDKGNGQKGDDPGRFFHDIHAD